MNIEQHSNYRYHLEMMLGEIAQHEASFRNNNYRDTRVYLSLDRGELQIVKTKLEEELKTTMRVLENKG